MIDIGKEEVVALAVVGAAFLGVLGYAIKKSVDRDFETGVRNWVNDGNYATPDEENKLASLAQLAANADSFRAKEKAELAREISAWETNSGYSTGMAAAKQAIEEATTTAKQRLDYDNALASATTAAHAAVEGYKTANNYDDIRASLKQQIAENERAFNTVKFTVDRLPAGEAKSTYLGQITSNYTSTKDELTGKLAELENGLAAAKKKCRDDISKAVEKLNKKLSEEVQKITSASKNEIDKWSDMRKQQFDRFRETLEGNRSEEVKTALDAKNQYDVLSKKLLTLREEIVESTLESNSWTTKFAWWLNDKKVPRWLVLGTTVGGYIVLCFTIVILLYHWTDKFLTAYGADTVTTFSRKGAEPCAAYWDA